MLTREVESSLIKCGKYWKDGQYGDITLQLISQEGVDDDKSKTPAPGGFFASAGPKDVGQDTIIERVFQLRNRAQPNELPRRIIHLQYLGWPDLDVPQSPGGLLTLIRRVNVATEEHSHASLKLKQGPVLLHCSAGVGRTGGFLLVDSILAGIRHEMLSDRSSLGQRLGPNNSSSEEMDVDEPESVISSGKPLQSSPPNNISSHSSSLPASTSGPESAPYSTETSSSTSFSEWSKHPDRGSSIATKSSPVAVPSPRKLSDLVVENLKMTSRSPLSAQAQVTAWSRKLQPHSRSNKPTPPSSVVGAMSSTEEFRTKGGVNYKLPRKLDELRGSPPMPSSFPEPIREVLEDMREQRMSLCQSLRQYVFAHRAILMGALELVDEAKEAERKKIRSNNAGMVSAASTASTTNETPWSSTSSIVSGTSDGPPSSSPTRVMAGRFSSKDREGSQGSSATGSPPPLPRTSTGKRGASPAGMTAGESSLLKRPSLKRKHKTADSQNDDIPRASTTRQHVLPNFSRGR